MPDWDRVTPPGLAIDLIAAMEAFRARAYQDSVGKWTIGYGSLRMPDGTPVRPGSTVTEAAARALLLRQADAWCMGLSANVMAALTVEQASALISWLHNLGVGSLQGSIFAAMLNAGRMDLAARQFGGWVYAGGRVNLGLMRRRELERRIFTGQGGLEQVPAVWALAQADLQPALTQAYADAAAWRRGGAAAKPVAPAAPAVPARVAAADDAAATDALNAASLAAARGG